MRAGFPHSDICGSKLVCQLPAAFRRLPRPSSPVIAKASTTCTYSLDPIALHTAQHFKQLHPLQALTRLPYLKLLQHVDTNTRIPIHTTRSAPTHQQQTMQSLNPMIQSTTPHIQRQYIRSTSSILLKNSQYPRALATRDDDNTSLTLLANTFNGGANRDRTGDLLLAKQALSQLSYSPSSSWWVWMDLNHRPHAYQACALTN